MGVSDSFMSIRIDRCRVLSADFVVLVVMSISSVVDDRMELGLRVNPITFYLGS